MLYYFECVGQENEKGEGKESYLFISNSLWNANNYEVISINNVTSICIREIMEKEVREWKKKKEKREEL